MFSVTSWRPKSASPSFFGVAFPTFEQNKNVMSLCHGKRRRLNFTGKSSYLSTVLSLVHNTSTATSPPSPPWENQHHLNTHTLWVKCQVSQSVWQTLNIVDCHVVTSDSLYNGLRALPDGLLPVFTCAVPVWHLKWWCLFSNVWAMIWEENETILMAENASVDGRVGKYNSWLSQSQFGGCKSVNLQSDTTLLSLTTYLVFLSLMG